MEIVYGVYSIFQMQCFHVTSCVLSIQGEWVWVPSDIGVPIGARVKVTPSGQRSLVDDEGKVNHYYFPSMVFQYVTYSNSVLFFRSRFFLQN